LLLGKLFVFQSFCLNGGCLCCQLLVLVATILIGGMCMELNISVLLLVNHSFGNLGRLASLERLSRQDTSDKCQV